MVKITNSKVILKNGLPSSVVGFEQGSKDYTATYKVLNAHNTSTRSSKDSFNIKFDALVSHDITYVGIIQTARASGLKEFPIPYALTNCHNSLCAVGGTINEDDHLYGLSAARKYGGIYVPANQSVIHSFARETLTKCGGMILGSDSHTRYGALGTMGVGEGGPELVKQLLNNTYDISAPEVILVYLTGAPKRGVGPQDVALALIKAVFASGFVKNKVLEFTGPGIASLSYDFRCGIDVMTTETACLSSLWETDDEIKKYYEIHGRSEDFSVISPDDNAIYDGMIEINLDKIEPMIALPFHPSNAYTIREFLENKEDIFAAVEKNSSDLFGGVKLDYRSKIRNGKVYADQGIIAGCSGGLYENIEEAASILRNASIGCGSFSLSVYPMSVPVNLALTRSGASEALLSAGALIKPSFCGPCFGAGDVPSNNGLSIRHTTRNFPNREGSKPSDGQISGVALMDARSIAATAMNGGAITPATEICYDSVRKEYVFDQTVYQKRVYNGYGKPCPEEELKFGPNITDWPTQYPMEENLLLELAAVIYDDVTTTDELIPSGETSSYRSNPLRLAEFTLSRRVPEYVGLSKNIRDDDIARRNGLASDKLKNITDSLGADISKTAFGSCIYAVSPGDGSAREQAASCQKILGGLANICKKFATKRYRSNCINWGIMPFTFDGKFVAAPGDHVYIPNIRTILESGKTEYPATVLRSDGSKEEITLRVEGLTDTEREIILLGGLINYYKSKL